MIRNDLGASAPATPSQPAAPPAFCTHHRWCLEHDGHEGPCRGFHHVLRDVAVKLAIKALRPKETKA